MTMTDPVADMLTRLRNANSALRISATRVFSFEDGMDTVSW